MPVEKIDKEVENILRSFVKEHIMPKILDKDNLLGIITYGSSATGYSSNNSDIDLLIVVNRADKTTRGVKIYQGRKIEYFIKPIEKFLSEGVNFSRQNCPSHVALEQNAYFLYDRGDFIANILKADATFYNENRQKLNENFDLKLVQIENRMASLKNIYDRNGKEFYMVYFNLLEMIRSLHSKRNDEADIPFAKAYKIYTDKNYYDKYVSSHAKNPLPDRTFVKLYTSCVEEHIDREKMMINLNKLYEFEKQFYKIDPLDYEIDV